MAKDETKVLETTAERIMEIKEELEEAKKKVSNLEGQMEVIKKNLKDEFGVKNLKEAVAKRDSLQKRADKLGIQINQKLKKLEEIMEENEAEDDE